MDNLPKVFRPFWPSNAFSFILLPIRADSVSKLSHKVATLIVLIVPSETKG